MVRHATTTRRRQDIGHPCEVANRVQTRSSVAMFLLCVLLQERAWQLRCFCNRVIDRSDPVLSAYDDGVLDTR